jgi:tetratricopeptide (TPR) repeat protein
VYGESEYAHIGFGWAGLKSLTTRQWKFIDAPRSELYDRTQDLAENVNLIDQHPEIAQQMRAKLQQIAASAKPAAPGSAANAQVLAQLRSLGYISAGSPAALAPGEQRRDPQDMIDTYNAYARAVELQLEKRYAEIVPIMEPLVQLSPESDDFHVTLGVAYLELGRAADAEKSFAASLSHAPENPRLLWRMADALYRQNKLDQAAAHLEAALKLDPNLAAAGALLGDILQQKGQLAQAVERWKAAVAAQPDLATVHGRLGVAYAYQGRFAEAEKHLRRNIELEPDSAHAHGNLGGVLLRLGRPAEAAQHLQTAVRHDPTDVAAHTTLSQALQAAGKPKEAIASLRRAASALPQAKVLTLRLAWLLATIPQDDMRDPEEALRLAHALCANGRPTAEDLTVLAAAYAANGDFQQAVANAQKAISLAQSQGNTAAAASTQTHLQQYQTGQALRIDPRASGQ